LLGNDFLGKIKLRKRDILGKVKDIRAKDTLYLIVEKRVWDKIVLGDKRIEYRGVKSVGVGPAKSNKPL